MLNDKSTSELISRSLSGALEPAQQKTVDEQIAENEQSRNFARISKMINDSLSDIGQRSVNGDETIAPGLSDDARLRMKQSIRQESANQSLLGPTVTGGSSQEEEARSSRTTGRSSGVDSDERTVKSRFVLTRQIGKGGLGTVWLARDEKLKRSVALKEMNPEAAEFPRAWERFHREAEITGHLEHPNVVPLYQAGTDETTGQPFYAMRFVGKRTLVNAIEEYHDRKAAGEDVTMDLHRLLTAFISVCQAIAYAHSRGVIHRDLKPENVALDNFGQVIVLDWGLAKVIDDHETAGMLSGDRIGTDSDFEQTMSGEVIGTPLYMAPEQAAGKLDDIDQRTDVYGLGAILFAMLTGSAPHRDSSLKDGSAVSMAELLQKISDHPSPRPRDYTNGIPADLESICLKAMQFKAHARHQTATEVSDDVQKWMAGRSDRRQRYANSRSEAREMRTAMLAAVRDLERNVRFMSSLPPIQGIVDAEAAREGNDQATWRERLAVIFKGLLKTNCDFSSVSYARADDSTFQELLRIERHATDGSNVRSIPASRLSSGSLTTCMQKALEGKPDEVYVALSSECPALGDDRPRTAGHITAAVPVFDAKTEELFGFVRIEASLEQLIENQIQGRFRATNMLYVLDNDHRLLIQVDNNGVRIRSNDGKPISEMASCWENVLPVLKDGEEFQDEQDHAFYATKVDLVPGRYSLALALCLAEKSAHACNTARTK